mmetsp:Transcript_23926/g.47810  ORF Transcript_23926/g.47810 Transcript_23926/m.47810 type:complete len:224 (+) Transcript_23926:938-1609(+)
MLTGSEELGYWLVLHACLRNALHLWKLASELVARDGGTRLERHATDGHDGDGEVAGGGKVEAVDEAALGEETFDHRIVLVQDGHELLARDLLEEDVLGRHVHVRLDALKHHVLSPLSRREARVLGREERQVALDSRRLEQLQFTVLQHRHRAGKAKCVADHLVALTPVAGIIERGCPRFVFKIDATRSTDQTGSLTAAADREVVDDGLHACWHGGEWWHRNAA